MKGHKSAYDLVKIKNWDRKRSHRRDGIEFGRIITRFHLIPLITKSFAYDQVKTRLSESEAETKG